ncbi:MAG: DNA photolyase FAD-binding protein, partial [Limisphaerales bacterium]
ADSLAEGLSRLGCQRLVTVAPAVGPLADEMPRIQECLQARGIALLRVRRRWDSELWPLAAKGFFPFWERVRARFL